VSRYGGGPARSATRSIGTSVTASDVGAIAAGSMVAVVAGRSSDGATAVLAGSVAPESTKQQRFGRIGGRGASGQCAAQHAIARSSATAARGAAMPTRTVMPTASTSTQAVSRFRDTEVHCMSGLLD
jgi:hypothetical protein